MLGHLETLCPKFFCCIRATVQMPPARAASGGLVGASLLAKAVFKFKEMLEHYSLFASKLAPTKTGERCIFAP